MVHWRAWCFRCHICDVICHTRHPTQLNVCFIWNYPKNRSAFLVQMVYMCLSVAWRYHWMARDLGPLCILTVPNTPIFIGILHFYLAFQCGIFIHISLQFKLWYKHERTGCVYSNYWKMIEKIFDWDQYMQMNTKLLKYRAIVQNAWKGGETRAIQNDMKLRISHLHFYSVYNQFYMCNTWKPMPSNKIDWIWIERHGNARNTCATVKFQSKIEVKSNRNEWHLFFQFIISLFVCVWLHMKNPCIL